jgi:hypothetical protein
LLGNSSAEDITVDLQEIDYDVVSVKQTTAKRPTPEGGITHTSLFLVTLARYLKAPEIFNLKTLRNIVIKSKLINPRTALHKAAIVSVLATSGRTTGSLLTACSVGVKIAILSAQRVPQSDAIATCKMGNHRT